MRNQFGVLFISASFLVIAANASAEEAKPGAIRGMLLTADHQQRQVGSAVVIVCDPKSGLPLAAETRQPLRAGDFQGPESLWHCVTSEGSTFEIPDMPAGEYRLLVQSWAGVNGMQSMKQCAKFPSAVTLAHGTAENVVVRPGETTDALIKELGTRQLTVSLDPNDEPMFIFVSTAPMRLDPVLGYYGWGDEFNRHIIAATHYSQPRSTFVGLPNDRELYIGVFCYDNLMGFGGAVVRPRETEITVPVHGSWSNGNIDPPARLLSLTEFLESSGQSWEEITQLSSLKELRDAKGHVDQTRAWQMLLLTPERRVPVGDLGEFPVKDVMAAEAYRGLREHRRKDKARQAERRKARAAQPATGAAQAAPAETP
ncbi:hypothetical protein [Lacipirellula parvula]|uniref:Carboxypeptidase regulatory-like domain-containing protein n=1 Tax=Lacipirellula parvula TaxID=2650471 RepID=A0A5K7X998_9BACT|nr:hypothetical protein [Lacipirellula parvula]BBO33270.1 hypothetical protein PLANPX_2882 [Lacipirellula parvula]